MGNAAMTGTLLVLVSAVMWGTTGTAQAFAPDGVAPMAVGAARLGIGGLGLLIVAVAGGAFREVTRVPWGTLAIAAFCIAAYQISFFGGVARTGVAVGTVIGIGSAPLLSGLIGWGLERRPPGWTWAAATALAVLGCGLLTLGGETAVVEPVGALMALGAGLAYAIYAAATKRLVVAMPPVAAMSLAFASGGLLLAPLWWTQDMAWLLTGQGALVALHLGLVTTTLANALWAFGLRATPIAAAVTLSLAEPLTAGLLGVLLLHEPFTTTGAVGMALILGGLVVLALGARRSTS